MLRRLYDQTWGRLFAAFYERSLSAAEDAGLREQRIALLRAAEGRCLEIGAGSGLNLDHWPPGVELTLTEPFEPMAKQLRARGADVVIAPAEQLPFDDDRFDTVVATLVLCTVDDPDRVLAEVARVLRPGGRLLFLEHVRSDDERVARKQDRWARPWRFVGHGCHPNRDTLRSIEASPLSVEHWEAGRVPKAPEIVRPLISGAAVAP